MHATKKHAAKIEKLNDQLPEDAHKIKDLEVLKTRLRAGAVSNLNNWTQLEEVNMERLQLE